MDTSKDQEPAFLGRASRMTRGKRMTKLLDEENEEDEVFWNQDALKDEENDNNYEQEAEVADEFDSDFNEDEPEADDEAVKEVDVRMPRKRLIYPGKPSTKKKRKSVALSNLESPDKRGKTSQQLTLTENNDVQDEAEEEKVVRRTSVVVRQAERDAIRAAIQATMKPIKRRKEGEEKRMTQEEMLLEAAQTEIMNLRNLEKVLAREEEVKKRAVVHKIVYSGPQIRYISKKWSSFHSDISTKTDPYPEKTVRAVTGLPAKYKDPKTELPYATKEAFQIIRQRYASENAKIERGMGSLFEPLSEQGFLSRRKRWAVSNKSVSYASENAKIERGMGSLFEPLSEQGFLSRRKRWAVSNKSVSSSCFRPFTRFRRIATNDS